MKQKQNIAPLPPSPPGQVFQQLIGEFDAVRFGLGAVDQLNALGDPTRVGWLGPMMGEVDPDARPAADLESLRDTATTERAVDVEVAISDRISSVQKAYYTVDYGDAQHHIAPLDGVFDSREEEARFTVEDLEPGEHVISVMVIDALDNVGVQQLVIRIE